MQTDPERPVKATAYLNAKLDQETARRSPGTPSGLSICLRLLAAALQVMWVPYTDDDVNLAFRFSIHAEQL
jgi:hypothetical protein